jgi:hypothetical protein
VDTLGIDGEKKRRLGETGVGVTIGNRRRPSADVAAFALKQRDRGSDGVDVAAVAVDEYDCPEKIGRSTKFDENVVKNGRTDRQSSSEAGVFARCAEVDRWPDNHVRCFGGDAPGDGFGDPGIGVERKMRPVLLTTPDRDEQERGTI